jgi:hypothetical protein
MLVCMHASVPYAGLDKEMNDCHARLLHKNRPNDQLDLDFFMQIKLVQILDPCLMQRKINSNSLVEIRYISFATCVN